MWRTKYPMNPIAIPPWEEQNLNRLNEITALNTNDHNNRDESKQKMGIIRQPLMLTYKRQ